MTMWTIGVKIIDARGIGSLNIVGVG